MSLLLYLAQEGRATTHRDTGLEKLESPQQSESRAPILRRKKKKERKRERETAGSRESTKRPGNSSQLRDSVQKRRGAVCYWKS